MSAQEKEQLNLHDAFLRIISGIEDMDDATSAYDLAVRELSGDGSDDRNPFNHLDRMEPLDRDQSVGGIYLSFTPRLELTRAAPAPAEVPWNPEVPWNFSAASYYLDEQGG
ncbi:hypothetical protein [Amycolatopsis sp. A1MSW2902]|uniref:hypothetical protein n=1 Tax=Amycolatopsis sp. A1MSW2902 TaxID=687413 RepID=UPI00307D9874